LLYSKFAWVCSQVVRGQNCKALAPLRVGRNAALRMGPAQTRAYRLDNGYLSSGGPAVRRESLRQAQLISEPGPYTFHCFEEAHQRQENA